MTMVKPELTAYVERRTQVLTAVRRMLLVSLGMRREPEEIDPDTALFGTGLGIDSVDAVEIVIALETEFKVKLSDPQERKLAALWQVENDLTGTVLERRIVRRATLSVAAAPGVGQQLLDVNRWRERHSNLLLTLLKVPESNAPAEHAGAEGLGPGDEP